MSHSPMLPEGGSVYLAGPMRGYPRFNFDAFEVCARWLRTNGWHVWSPAEHDLQNGFDPESGEGLLHLKDYMRVDLPRVLESDAVVVMDGWGDSAGARIELYVAQACGIPVYRFRDLTLVKNPTGLEAPLTGDELPWSEVLSNSDLGYRVKVHDINRRFPWLQAFMIDNPDTVVVDVDASPLRDGFVRETFGLWPHQEQMLSDLEQTSCDVVEEKLGGAMRDINRLREQELDAAAQRIVTNEVTGGMKETRPARFDLLPWDQLWKVAELYAYGATKYADRNWENGYDFSLSLAALFRHAAKFAQGEDVDTESEQHHLASVVFHSLALMRFQQEIDAGRMPEDLDTRPDVGFDDTRLLDLTPLERAA